MKFLNLHDAKADGPGNIYAAPGRHLSALGWDAHAALFADLTAATMLARHSDALLLGGGVAAPYHPWLKALGALAGSPDARRVVAWGIGTNYYDMPRRPRHAPHYVERTELKYPDWVQRVADGGALVGVRDIGSPYQWVPDPSCLLPQFDEYGSYARSLEAVAYEDPRHPLGLAIPTLSSAAPLGEALAHLASAEVVVTNTYHGAYWATLLGRRVVVAGDFSNRVRHMKHSPAFSDAPGAWRKAAENADVYSDALSECREATRAFAEQVMARFGFVSDVPPAQVVATHVNAAARQPLVVGFYTNAEYRARAERMAESARAVGLEVELVERPDRGRWLWNNFQKPAVIREAMDTHGRDVMYVDADAEFRRTPREVLALDSRVDLAAYQVGHALWGCALFVRNSKGGRSVLDAWERQNAATPKFVDDSNLLYALRRHRWAGTFLRLPATYAWSAAKPDPAVNQADVVLAHDMVVTHRNPAVRHSHVLERTESDWKN